MRRLLLGLLLSVLALPAWADSTIPGLNAAGAAAGTDLFPTSQSGGDAKKQTNAALAAYIMGLLTGDCTATGLGAITCTKTGGVAFGTAATVNTGTSGGTLPLLNSSPTASGNWIFSGSVTLNGAATLNGTVSGTGINNLFASPPATGTGTPAAGNYTTLTATGNVKFNGLGSAAQVLCIGLDASFNLATSNGACGTGGGGSVSVTAGSADINVNPSPGTGTFTVGGKSSINAQTTATSYTIQSSDLGKTVTFNGTASVAVTLPNAASAGFTAGFRTKIVNLGTGIVTVTPTTSTINGGSAVLLGQNQSIALESDSTNYVGTFFPGPSSTSGITAHAGGGQGSATALLADVNTVSTVTTAGDSVALPPWSAGAVIAVINQGANSLQAFGTGTDTINGSPAATGVTQAIGTALYFAAATGNWVQFTGGSGNAITALTSDVTANGPGSVAATIAAQAVTFAKMQNVANGTVAANTSGSTGSMAATTPSALLDAVFGSTRGMVLYRGVSGWAALAPPGSAGTYTFTISGGGGSDPFWSAGGAGCGAGQLNFSVACNSGFVAIQIY